MKNTKKKFVIDRNIVLILLIIVTILFLFYIFQPITTSDFLIKYTQNNGFKSYTEDITISSTGEYDYKMLDYRTDNIRNSFSRKLSESEMQELSNLIITSNFFILPDDLTTKCFDASDESMEIVFGGKSKKSGGNCVMNNSFRKIVDKLYSYKIQ